MMNYGRELRMGADIRRKEKVEQTTKFAEIIKKIQEKVGVVLRKAQEKIKRQADKRRRKTEEWKRGDKVQYKRFGVQEKTSKEVSGPICQSIYH